MLITRLLNCRPWSLPGGFNQPANTLVFPHSCNNVNGGTLHILLEKIDSQFAWQDRIILYLYLLCNYEYIVKWSLMNTLENNRDIRSFGSPRQGWIKWKKKKKNCNCFRKEYFKKWKIVFPIILFPEIVEMVYGRRRRNGIDRTPGPVRVKRNFSFPANWRNEKELSGIGGRLTGGEKSIEGATRAKDS